jgi:outer membrane protein assembly factor BamB
MQLRAPGASVLPRPTSARLTLSMKTTLSLSLATTLLLAGAPAFAAEWSQIGGPTFNRTSAEPIADTLASLQPRKLWEISTGGGFSSFVTGGGRAYTVTQAGGRETVIAVDRKTGKTLWSAALSEADYRSGGDRGTRDNSGGDGPRVTPVFADGRLFVMDGKFIVNALDSATGKLLWKHDLIKDFGGREISWSSAASPLVVGDRVLVSGGGNGQSCLAFRADTGAVLWKAGSDAATHSTPILATIHGKAQALFVVARGVVSRDPADGKELWHYAFPHQTSTAASPVVWQDIVNITAAYGVGGGACKVTRTGDKWEATELWRSRGNQTASHWSTAVVHDGFLYGCYGQAEPGSGPFKCIDIRTGEVKWTQPGFGPSQVILAGNRLLATTDAGKLVVIEPTPAAYKEISSTKVIAGKVWASMALSDRQLLVRSTTQGVCLEL